MVISTAASALLTGQPTFAACAACWNASASRPSTSARTVSAMRVIASPPSCWPSVTSALTSSDCGVPPALPISFDSDMAKHAECAAAMSSSGLVTPPASSAARFGKFTSKVPTLELDSSTWPDPSCRVPVQAVRAVRVGMRASVVTSSRDGPLQGVLFSADGAAVVHALDQQPQPLLELVELAGVEPDGADHGLGDRQRPLPQRAPLLGQGDADRAFVLHPPVPGHETGRGEPLEQRGQRAAVEGQLGAELADGLVVVLPEQHHDQVLRIGQPQLVEHRTVAGGHGARRRVEREAQLVVEDHARSGQPAHAGIVRPPGGALSPRVPDASAGGPARRLIGNRRTRLDLSGTDSTLPSLDRVRDHTRPSSWAAPSRGPPPER